MSARAAIDCGTNTIRLLVADGDRTLVRAERIVRLGEGVDATGVLAPAALARTFAAVDEYAALIVAHGAATVRFAATSAARDARNAHELDAGVRARLGTAVEVLTGDREARLSFLGAVAGAGMAGPVLVTDIGGGSTELVVGDPDGTVAWARSLNIGAVRLRERFLPSDPPAPGEVAAARAYADRLLDALDLPWGDIATWVGVAGTFTTAAALELGLPAYDPARVDRAHLDPSAVERLVAHCLTTPVAAWSGHSCRGPVPR